MNEIARSFFVATSLLSHADPELVGVVLLSLRISLTATAIAFALGMPPGALLAITRLPGRIGILVFANASLGLPPVVVGLIVYLAFSRSGPLGSLGLLFTPGAMIVARTVLALPIVIALTHRIVEGLWETYGDALTIDGASQSRSAATLLAMGPHSAVSSPRWAPCPGCFRLERLPGGPCSHWKSAAFSRRTWKAAAQGCLRLPRVPGPTYIASLDTASPR